MKMGQLTPIGWLTDEIEIKRKEYDERWNCNIIDWWKKKKREK